MARLTASDGRSRIPLLIVAAVLVIAVIGGGALLLGRNSNPAAVNSRAASEPTPSPTDSVIYDGSYDPAPTGCLGGEQRTPQMVLAAQKKAGHSAFGAVEVAAAVFRWSVQYPYPAPDDVREIRSVLDPETAAKQQQDWVEDYASRKYTAPPGLDLAEGTPFYVTTANGGWLTTSSSTSDQVDVQLSAHPVADGSYSTSTVTLQVNLRWVSGSWHVSGLEMANAQALANGSTSFTSGC